MGVPKAPVLAAADRLLQHCLGREVKCGRRPARGVAPVYDALPVRVLSRSINIAHIIPRLLKDACFLFVPNPLATQCIRCFTTAGQLLIIVRPNYTEASLGQSASRQAF